MAFFGKKIFLGKNKKKNLPGGLWVKCPSCLEMLYNEDLRTNLQVCSICDHHFRMERGERIASLVEEDSFEEWDENLYSVDELKFKGVDSYTDKIKQNQNKTGKKDAVSCGRAKLNHHDIALGVMDFNFLGGSMGSVVGEKITRLIEGATTEGIPVVIVCASGGARMYEGLFSLMQMAKTSGALARHAEKGLAYIPILTHPTTAGVMASFATLGDVIIAEPDALIGFAGARVIKETTQQDLPEGFQRPDFLLAKGLLDMVVHRRDMKQRVSDLLDYFTQAETPEKVLEADAPEDSSEDPSTEGVESEVENAEA